jgi:hypothetical protein
MTIENAETLDVMAVRKDGKGVDLIIVSSGSLDGSPETQKLLLDKIENYLGYINSVEFTKEIGKFEAKNIIIRLSCSEKPDTIIMELIKKIIPWVEENGARFEVEIK